MARKRTLSTLDTSIAYEAVGLDLAKEDAAIPDFVSLKTAMACATRERAILNFTSRSANRSKVFHTEFSHQRALFLEPARRL